MVFFKLSSVFSSAAIFFVPWMIVVWSRPPRAFPMFCRDSLVISPQRYITICRGNTNSLLRFCPIKSRELIPKCSDTTFKMSCGVTSLMAFGEIKSFKASSASSIFISLLFNLLKATILVRAPSSSRILDFTLDAMYLITSLSML